MKPRQQTRADSAFSLVELLVVIAIVGILLALLLPALSRSLQRARMVACINNVRQLGQGLQEVVAESHNYPLYVDATVSNGLPRNVETWTTILGDQLGHSRRNRTNFWTRDIWLCPGVKSNGVLKEGFDCYGYNAFGIGADTNSLGLGGTYGFTHTVPIGIGNSKGGFPIVNPPVEDSLVKQPSEMMAIGDGFHGNKDKIYSGQGMLWRHDSFTGFFSTSIAIARHQGKANVVFCDGHVESPTLKFLFEDTSDAALVRWNRDHLPHREKLPP